MMSFRISPFLKRRPYWYPGDDADWAADVEPVITREDDALRERLIALGRWYSIDSTESPNPLIVTIYRYLNRVQSSRRLEREAGRNLEVM